MNRPRICTQPCNARRHTCCRAAAPHLRPTRKNASRKRRRDARDNVANAGPPAIGPLAGGEQMMAGLLRLRFAACACLLAAGLLMGAGGAVAVADPASSGSAANGDDGSPASGQQHPPARKSRRSQRTSLAARTPRMARLARAANQASSIPPARKSRRTRKSQRMSLAARTPRMGRKPTRTSVPRLLIRSPRFRTRSRRFLSGGGAGSGSGRRGSGRGRAGFMAAPPVPDVVGPVSDVNALVQDMLTSVTGAVVPLTQLQSDLYSFLLGIARVAPVSDVSALVQDMLRSVVEAVVLLAQLPSDLSSFLLDIAGVQPVVGGVGGIHGPGLSAPAGASVASRLPLGLPLRGLPVSRACR